ncbi:MAG: hypothetical protein E5Y12_17775 [Mesorhizobium sp.]|nr:MAG: hypothetical protein E5Y12_17775 [Mesorhizobium sp.]
MISGNQTGGRVLTQFTRESAARFSRKNRFTLSWNCFSCFPGSRRCWCASAANGLRPHRTP